MSGRREEIVESSQPHVLVVDADGEVRETASEILRRAGHRVTIAGPGDRGTQPDVVLSTLEGASSWFDEGVLTLPFEQFAYAVLLQPASEAVPVDQFLQLGFDDVLALPFTPRSLLERVAVGLRVVRRERHSHRELRTDPVTRLPNRRACDEAITGAWGRHRETDLPITCAMIDVDHFKLVNDDHGHVVGDELLAGIAGKIAECRKCEFVGRYGGDEFLLLFGSLSESDATRAIRQIVRRVADSFGESGTVSATITAGVAESSPGMATPNAWLELADERLRSGKAAGRNRVISAGCRSHE